MNKFTVIAALMLLSGSAFAANWAVLVAGSNGFYNYRHQADICHAYQILIKGGIPASNIIVFSYDDVASSSMNPFKGKLFNKPDGDDVYAGCVIDYKANDCNPQNFLSVLKQDAAAVSGKGTGRVLKSTANDKVFINFADHGAPGLIAFPTSYLYEKDLTPVLNSMWTKKQYQEAVFYLEACESGSMFVNTPKNQKFYALSAASPSESSWGWYCPPDDSVHGTHIGSCLGDLFSINWMEDTESADTKTETLQTQFQNIKTKTTKSQVMQWGDLSFTSETVNNFVGSIQKVKTERVERPQGTSVDSRDAKLMFLINRHARLMTSSTQDELNEEIMSRRRYDDIFHEIQEVVGSPEKADQTEHECYKDMIDTLEAACGRTSDYGLKYFRRLFDICACPTCNHLQAKLIFLKRCSVPDAAVVA